MDPKEIFEYSQFVRNRYLDQLAKLPWEQVTKSRGGSFDSLRNIMLHTIDVENRIICVIAGRATDWVSLDPDEFPDMDSIKKRSEETESKTKAILARLTPVELDRKVEFPSRHPEVPPIFVRVEDALIHTALENIHHFGELIALLWQMDIEPPHMGWIAYLRNRRTHQ
jgi:uncharacterized damage-inducible protein DinB